jgi:tRNA nucleotidyltransferase (CCA-adding enzyme)
LKKLIASVGIDNLDSLFHLQTADIKASALPHDFEPVEYLRRETSKILDENQPITIKDLAIKGSDLIELGFKPGKKMGEVLNYLLEVVLEKPGLNTKENLIKFINREDV